MAGPQPGFFDGKVRCNDERDKTRPEAQVPGEGGGGELRCLRLHFKRFEGSVERKQAAKRRNVDISQNV